jgi:hypothetical protein
LRVVLLGLLLVVLLGAEIPEIHDHNADTPGLYNEECPLGRLAVPGWGLAAGGRDSLPQRDPASDPATLPASAEPSAAPRPAFAARAPPATS